MWLVHAQSLPDGQVDFKQAQEEARTVFLSKLFCSIRQAASLPVILLAACLRLPGNTSQDQIQELTENHGVVEAGGVHTSRYSQYRCSCILAGYSYTSSQQLQHHCLFRDNGEPGRSGLHDQSIEQCRGATTLYIFVHVASTRMPPKLMVAQAFGTTINASLAVEKNEKRKKLHPEDEWIQWYPLEIRNFPHWTVVDDIKATISTVGPASQRVRITS